MEPVEPQKAGVGDGARPDDTEIVAAAQAPTSVWTRAGDAS